MSGESVMSGACTGVRTVSNPVPSYEGCQLRPQIKIIELDSYVTTLLSRNLDSLHNQRLPKIPEIGISQGQ